MKYPYAKQELKRKTLILALLRKAVSRVEVEVALATIAVANDA